MSIYFCRSSSIFIIVDLSLFFFFTSFMSLLSHLYHYQSIFICPTVIIVDESLLLSIYLYLCRPIFIIVDLLLSLSSHLYRCHPIPVVFFIQILSLSSHLYSCYPNANFSSDLSSIVSLYFYASHLFVFFLKLFSLFISAISVVQTVLLFSWSITFLLHLHISNIYLFPSFHVKFSPICFYTVKECVLNTACDCCKHVLTDKHHFSSADSTFSCWFSSAKFRVIVFSIRFICFFFFFLEENRDARICL